MGVWGALCYPSEFYIETYHKPSNITWKKEYVWLGQAVFFPGAILSSLFSGHLMKFGKLKLIHITNAVLCLGSGLCLIMGIWTQVIGRTLLGASIGIFSVLVPKFINETAPSEYKGPYGVMSQFMITFGILVSSLLGLNIPES